MDNTLLWGYHPVCEALRAGRIEEYYRQRVADEIELWRTLDLDVYHTV